MTEMFDVTRGLYMVFAGIAILFLIVLVARSYQQGRWSDQRMTWYCLALLTLLISSIAAVYDRLGRADLSPTLIVRYVSMALLFKAFSHSFDFSWWKSRK